MQGNGAMASLIFEQLNLGWNAYPNGSDSTVELRGDNLLFRFELNPYVFDDVKEGDVGLLTFAQCARWRLGLTNDEGFYRGQCRYSSLAPSWGEFYELVGDDPARYAPVDWQFVDSKNPGNRHFLFYLRDETFECIAGDWEYTAPG